MDNSIESDIDQNDFVITTETRCLFCNRNRSRIKIRGERKGDDLTISRNSERVERVARLLNDAKVLQAISKPAVYVHRRCRQKYIRQIPQVVEKQDNIQMWVCNGPEANHSYPPNSDEVICPKVRQASVAKYGTEHEAFVCNIKPEKSLESNSLPVFSDDVKHVAFGSGESSVAYAQLCRLVIENQLRKEGSATTMYALQTTLNLYREYEGLESWGDSKYHLKKLKKKLQQDYPDLIFINQFQKSDSEIVLFNDSSFLKTAVCAAVSSQEKLFGSMRSRVELMADSLKNGDTRIPTYETKNIFIDKTSSKQKKDNSSILPHCNSSDGPLVVEVIQMIPPVNDSA